MICLGLAALFYYQGKAVNQSRKKMNFKLISNRLSPAPRLSELKSGSKKLSKVVSINSKEKDMEGVNPPIQTDNTTKNEYQQEKKESHESEELSSSQSITGESNLERREFFINNIFCGYLMD